MGVGGERGLGVVGSTGVGGRVRGKWVERREAGRATAQMWDKVRQGNNDIEDCRTGYDIPTAVTGSKMRLFGRRRGKG